MSATGSCWSSLIKKGFVPVFAYAWKPGITTARSHSPWATARSVSAQPPRTRSGLAAFNPDIVCLFTIVNIRGIFRFTRERGIYRDDLASRFRIPPSSFRDRRGLPDSRRGIPPRRDDQRHYWRGQRRIRSACDWSSGNDYQRRNRPPTHSQPPRREPVHLPSAQTRKLH